MLQNGMRNPLQLSLAFCHLLPPRPNDTETKSDGFCDIRSVCESRDRGVAARTGRNVCRRGQSVKLINHRFQFCPTGTINVTGCFAVGNYDDETRSRREGKVEASQPGSPPRRDNFVSCFVLVVLETSSNPVSLCSFVSFAEGHRIEHWRYRPSICHRDIYSISTEAHEVRGFVLLHQCLLPPPS